MFKNYFKIALRDLWKQKDFSAINMMDLTVKKCLHKQKDLSQFKKYWLKRDCLCLVAHGS
jgi:hypothetical protein